MALKKSVPRKTAAGKVKRATAAEFKPTTTAHGAKAPRAPIQPFPSAAIGTPPGELRESEERYRLLADNAEDFVALNDTCGNRLYLSPSFYRQTGWTPEEVQTGDWGVRLHPDDLPLINRTRAANLAGETTTIEHRIRCRNGSWIWVETRCKPLADGQGKVWRLLLLSRDITARKEAEKALRESEERLRLVLEASRVGTFEINLQSGGAHWNKVEFELLGLKPGDVPPGPETFFRFVHPDDLGYLSGLWEKATRTGEFNAEFRIVRADGEVRWLAGKGGLVFEGKPGGRATRFLGVNYDITEQRRLENELLEITDREQRRIGQDLHDGLGQRLTALEMKCFLLLKDLAADDLAAGREKLLKQARQVGQALQECVTATRSIAQGLAPVALQAEGLPGALEQLAQDTRVTGKVQCRFACSVPVTVSNLQTAKHLYRIAQEAVNNALKHARARHIAISLKRGRGGLCLQIKDDGRGLSARKNLKRGMGLEVMRHRAQAIGASLEIESKPGQGVQVTCILPIKDEA